MFAWNVFPKRAVSHSAPDPPSSLAFCQTALGLAPSGFICSPFCQVKPKGLSRRSDLSICTLSDITKALLYPSEPHLQTLTLVWRLTNHTSIKETEVPPIKGEN